MNKEELDRIKKAYSSGLKVQIWFNGHWEDFDSRDYSMYPEPFSENRQYRIVGSDYADVAEKRIAELEKTLAEQKEFYENEYFQIADRTADEKIKELEKNQVEVTIDDYSPHDPNTWGDMHEEWFVPKEAVRDLLKENYALITKAKDLLKWFVWYFREGSPNLVPYKHKVAETELFLKGASDK